MEGIINKTVFIDRDGTINEERHYVHKKEDFVFHENAPEAIKLLRANGFLVVVITNQAGIAKGLYDETHLSALHEWVNSELTEKGTTIDAFYYCPHHPQGTVEQYRIDCSCRKPKSGLILKAARELNIDLGRSFMIGDKDSDIIAGKNAGLKTILVLTGYGNEHKDCGFDFCSENLYEAAKIIVDQSRI